MRGTLGFPHESSKRDHSQTRIDNKMPDKVPLIVLWTTLSIEARALRGVEVRVRKAHAQDGRGLGSEMAGSEPETLCLVQTPSCDRFSSTHRSVIKFLY
jgi:hypothetical protein